MDLDVPQPALLALLRAVIRTDLLRAEGAPAALPWDELAASLFPGAEPARALRYAQCAQRALARAAHEAWGAPALEAYLAAGGLEAGRAAAAGALWAREREGVLAAVAARAYAPAPRLAGAPAFSVATLTASSEGAVTSGAEPLAMLALATSGGPVVCEASRAVLAAAAAALGAARKAVAGAGAV